MTVGGMGFIPERLLMMMMMIIAGRDLARDCPGVKVQGECLLFIFTGIIIIIIIIIIAGTTALIRRGQKGLPVS